MFSLQKFQHFIAQHQLLHNTQRVLLTVSGGSDSVFLAHLFKRAGYSCGIAHCNFNLRGEESLRDENFVKQLATQLDMSFYVTHFDTKAHAAAQQVSTQMAARELRYAWFEEVRITEKYDFIAVAHHQTDAVETVLLNLTRGTGIAGLHGIKPKRGNIIRPLLCFSRAEIDEILAQQHIAFVEDSSNKSSAYARNKIRLQVIPQLKLINPNLERTFEQNIRRFSETEMVLAQVVAQLRNKIVKTNDNFIQFALAEIRQLQPAQLLLQELLKPYHFEEPVVADILQSLDKQSGVSFYSYSHRATLNRDQLLISKLESQNQPPVTVLQPDDTMVTFGRYKFYIKQTADLRYEQDTQKAFVDTDQLIFPLTLRTWQEGDRFMPLGMTTFKKLSDYFIDQKVPLPLKAQVPVLVNGNGELIWLAGMRADNRYKVSSATKKVTIFEVKLATIEL